MAILKGPLFSKTDTEVFVWLDDKEEQSSFAYPYIPEAQLKPNFHCS